MSKITPSEQQEKRILQQRRDELEKEAKTFRTDITNLKRDKHLLETGIFRLKDDYARQHKMFTSLVERREQLEEQLHLVNEELRAKQQELQHGTENQ